MCPFSYWRVREGNSKCTGKFHQSPDTKKKKLYYAKISRVLWVWTQVQVCTRIRTGVFPALRDCFYLTQGLTTTLYNLIKYYVFNVTVIHISV